MIKGGFQYFLFLNIHVHVNHARVGILTTLRTSFENTGVVGIFMSPRVEISDPRVRGDNCRTSLRLCGHASAAASLRANKLPCRGALFS